MYRVLKNPIGQPYEMVKDTVFNQKFEWVWQRSSTQKESAESTYRGEHRLHTDAPFYNHILLQRPEYQLYPEVQSKHCNLFVDCLEEIIDANKSVIPFHHQDHMWTRMSVNATHPNTGIQYSMPHIDHRFPHYNMLIYLNDCDGETFIGDKCVEPEEDKVIVFEGNHHMRLPTSGRRVILIATLINYAGNI